MSLGIDKALLALRLAEFESEYDEAEKLVEKALEGSPNDPRVIRHGGKFFRLYGSVDRSIALLKRALEHSPNSGFIHHQLALCYKSKTISLQKQESRDSPSADAEMRRLRRQRIYRLEKATTGLTMSRSLTHHSAQAALLETQLQQLECHFTWELKKEDANITDLLNRLEEHDKLHLGGKAGVAQTNNSLAFVKYLLGFPTEALGCLQKSEELTKEFRENDCDKWLIVTYGNLAWLQYHMKSYAECESYLEKLRDIAERFPTEPASALHHEVLGEKAWALFKFSRENYERAKECFRKALELEPRDPQWNAGYAFVLHRDESRSCSRPDHSLAVKLLRKAIDTNPDNDELKALLALRLAEFESEYDEAEKLVEKALEGSPNDPRVIRYVGKFFRLYGSVDRSIALLKRALEHSPNSGFIHHQLALCYKSKTISLQKQESRDSPSADAEIRRLRRQRIYHLEKATTLKTDFVIAMIQLAVQYGEDDQLDRAEHQFQEALMKAKEKNEFLQQLYFYYGEFHQYRKRFLPLAINYYKECLKIKHDSIDGKKSVKKLTKIADRDLSKNPQNGRAWGILGFIHKEKGEKIRAIECYEKALLFKSSDEHLSALCELRLSL